MDIIKENMFFVVMGALVLLALVLFGALVHPKKSHNDGVMREVEGLKRDLGNLAKESAEGEGRLPNARAITEATAYNEEYQRQLRALRDELSTKKLSGLLPNLAPAEQDQPGAFKAVYEKNIEALKRRLTEKGITTQKDELTWKFWNWGNDVPRQKDQRVLASKEFELTRELIEILTIPELGVVQLDYLEVNPAQQKTSDYVSTRGELTENRVWPYFNVFPFVLELRMPFHKYEILIENLLRSREEIPIYIRTLSFGRLDDDLRVFKAIPPLLVKVRVTGWALDYYYQEKPTTQTAGGPFRPGMR